MFAERTLSPPSHQPIYRGLSNFPEQNIYGYQNPIVDANIHPRDYEQQSYGFQRSSPRYSTLPSRKTQITDLYPERSVTPDITRGLINKQINTNSMGRNSTYRTNEFTPNMYQPPPPYYQQYNVQRIDQTIGIPIKMPQIPNMPTQVPSHNYLPNYQKQDHFEKPQHNAYYSQVFNRERYDYTSTSPKVQDFSTNDTLRISPIDPRNTGSFHSSTPSKIPELKSATNLENKLMSPKKSTMSNDELYAAIHKSKKKMNITTEEIDRNSPSLSSGTVTPGSSENSLNKLSMKSPETGYIGDKPRCRLSWSPGSGSGEYIDFNTNLDTSPPPSESRSRQSWACTDRKGNQQTSRLDFKKLLLQHGKNVLPTTTSKKLSAVEQLKLSRQQIQASNQQTECDMSILDLSGSPRNLGNRKFANNPTSPKNNPDKNRSASKLLSPRSQWKFANPRSDVLSSTILEDCGEDESLNNSGENRNSPKKQEKLNNQICITKCNTEKSPTNQNNPRRQIFTDNVPKSETNKPSLTLAQRIQAQRAQFFNSSPPPTSSGQNNKFHTISGRASEKEKCPSPPTLETAF